MQIPRLKLPGKSRVGTSLLARVASGIRIRAFRKYRRQSRACCYARLKVNFDFGETGETRSFSASPLKREVFCTWRSQCLTSKNLISLYSRLLNPRPHDQTLSPSLFLSLCAHIEIMINVTDQHFDTTLWHFLILSLLRIQRLEFISDINIFWHSSVVKNGRARKVSTWSRNKNQNVNRQDNYMAVLNLSRLTLRYESHRTKVWKMSGSPLLKYVYNMGGWRGLYSNIIEMQFHREHNAPSGCCKTILLCSIDSARRRVWHLAKVLVNILPKRKPRNQLLSRSLFLSVKLSTL